MNFERKNYDSGRDYVLEYGELKFTFREADFRQRLEHAAKMAGIIDDTTVLNDAELEDLVDLVVNGEIPEGISDFGDHLESILYDDNLMKRTDQDGSLVHWLRRLTFRGAWLDQRVIEGELKVEFDPDTNDFLYYQPGVEEPIKLAEPPSWTHSAYQFGR